MSRGSADFSAESWTTEKLNQGPSVMIWKLREVRICRVIYQTVHQRMLHDQQVAGNLRDSHEDQNPKSKLML